MTKPLPTIAFILLTTLTGAAVGVLILELLAR